MSEHIKNERRTVDAVDDLAGKAAIATAQSDREYVANRVALQPANFIASAPATSVAPPGPGLTVPEDLIRSARSGDISAFDALLLQASQKDLSYQDKEGVTPLIAAVRAGRDDIVRKLIARDALVNQQDSQEGYTALMYAIKQGSINAVLAILQSRAADLSVRGNDGKTATTLAITDHMKALLRGLNGPDELVNASRSGNAALVKDLLCLAQPGDLKYETKEEHSTALIAAARAGSTEVVRLLIAHGAPVNQRESYYKMSAIIVAAQRGRNDVLAALLDAQADVNAQDTALKTALIFAARDGHLETVKLRLSRGADVDICDNIGYPALFYALLFRKQAVARLLIQHNANVNLQDNKGYTALMWMAETGNKEGVLIIMQSGKADSTLRAKDGRSAMDVANSAETRDFLRGAVVESLPAPPRPVPSRAAPTAPAKIEAAILPPAPPVDFQSITKAPGVEDITLSCDPLPQALKTVAIKQNSAVSALQLQAAVARTSTDGAHALTTVDAPMQWVAADGEAARDDDGAWDPVYVPNADVDRTIFK